MPFCPCRQHIVSRHLFHHLLSSVFFCPLELCILHSYFFATLLSAIDTGHLLIPEIVCPSQIKLFRKNTSKCLNSSSININQLINSFNFIKTCNRTILINCCHLYIVLNIVYISHIFSLHTLLVVYIHYQ